jgi:3'-phosphoadenosine 5'-phosphosulfate sulfotransferase (PAPS reductase)/FAD synthetase
MANKKENRHEPGDLAQFQCLPLEAKIRMTKERIKAWYESWTRFEICNTKTGKTRFVTMDTREFGAEPPLKESEWIKSAVDGQVYVSFSGGKDSTVLKHIVDSMYDDVPALFVNTGLEYPEIQKFAMSQKNVVTVRPEMRFDEVIKRYGYPVASKEVARAVKYARKQSKSGEYYLKRFNGELLTKDGKKSMYNMEKWKFLLESNFDVDSSCCDVMKKKPSKMYGKETGRKPIVGTMAAESRLRYKNWLLNGCNAFEAKNPQSQPMSFWTEQDVLHYIKKYNVPYCSVYGDIVVDFDSAEDFENQMNIIDYLGDYEPEDKLKTTGCDRTGCIFCMFGCHLEKEPNRFQRLKETHPRQYAYCIGGGEMVDGKWQPSKEGLGLGHVLDYIGVKYD